MKSEVYKSTPALQSQDSLFIKLSRWILAAWVFVIVLALFPYTADPAAPIKMLLTHGALLLVSALCVLDAAMFPSKSPRASGLLFAVPAALITLALCAFPLLDTLYQGMADAARWWLILLALAAFFARVYTKADQVIRFFQIFLCAVALSSLYGWIQRLGLDPFPWGITDTLEYLNLPATYGNSNFAGHVMVLAILLSLGLAWHKREPFYLLFTMMSAFHLYLTHMRAGWLALAGALALLLVFGVVRRMAGTPFKAAVVSVGLLFLAGAVGIGALLFVLAKHADQIPPLDSSLQLRLNGYANAADMIFEHPFVGVGPGRYIEETPAYWTDFEKKWYALEEMRNGHVHNEPLEFGVEFGLGGVFIYALFFFGALLGALYSAGRARFGEDRMLGLLLASLIMALAVDGLFGFNLHVPVSAALAFAVFGLVTGLLARERAPRRGLLAALLLLFSVGVSAWFEVQSFQAEMQYQRAQGARQFALSMQGNPERFNYGLNEATLSLQKAMAWKPWEPRFAKLVAMVETTRGNFAGEHTAWVYALQFSPNDPRALYGVLDSALNDFLQSANADVGTFLQSTQARDYLTRLQNLTPEWPDYLVIAGRLADEVEKNQDKAKTLYRSALEHGAKNPAYLNWRIANIESNAGNTAALPQLYRNVVEADPTVTQAWDALKSSSFPTDTPQEWIELLHAAWMKTRGNPAAISAHVYLARETSLAYVQKNAGYRALALNIFEETLKYAPDNPLLLQTKKEINLMPLTEDASTTASVPSTPPTDIASAREALALMPDDNGLKLNLARLLAKDGKDAEAIFHYMVLLRNMSQDDAARAQVSSELEALKAKTQTGKESPSE